jgi:hypothetical protein
MSGTTFAWCSLGPLAAWPGPCAGELAALAPQRHHRKSMSKVTAMCCFLASGYQMCSKPGPQRCAPRPRPRWARPLGAPDEVHRITGPSLSPTPHRSRALATAGQGGGRSSNGRPGSGVSRPKPARPLEHTMAVGDYGYG